MQGDARNFDRVGSIMDLAFSQDEQAFRHQCKDFFASFSPEEQNDCWRVTGLLDTFTEGDALIVRRMAKKLAKDGWLTLSWPREYGGQEVSNTKRLIFLEEAGYHRVPVLSTDMGVGGMLWISPLIMAFGTEKQKKEHLPPTGAGDRIWCSGYSEPEAGSDFLSLKTQAIRDGDYYIVNGQKIWITAAHFADWCWLAVRTQQKVKKSEGISLLLVDMKTPGIEVKPILSTEGHHSFNEVFFENVRVPKENLLGKEGEGWSIIGKALSLERSVNFIHFVGSMRRAMEELVNYANHTRHGGSLLAHDHGIRSKLANMAVEIEVARLLAYKLCHSSSPPHYEASKVKLFVSDLIAKLANTATYVLGPYSQLAPGTAWAPLRGVVEYTYSMSFAPPIGAGSNEIERGIIAKAGLGLPMDR
jgi:hypothetical protein